MLGAATIEAGLRLVAEALRAFVRLIGLIEKAWPLIEPILRLKAAEALEQLDAKRLQAELEKTDDAFRKDAEGGDGLAVARDIADARRGLRADQVLEPTEDGGVEVAEGRDEAIERLLRARGIAVVRDADGPEDLG